MSNVEAVLVFFMFFSIGSMLTYELRIRELKRTIDETHDRLMAAQRKVSQLQFDIVTSELAKKL